MLYQRWLEIVAAGPDRTAVWDKPGGRSWSFEQLETAARKEDASSAIVMFSEAGGIGFILSVLRAWRGGCILCPLESGQKHPDIPKEVPSGIAHLKFTSATTGIPRMVAFTEMQLAADADNIVATMGLNRDCPNLGVISLAHSYGFSNLVLPLLLHGIPLIMAGSPLPESLRVAASGHPRLTLPAVPALWRAWHETGAIPANVTLAISAGAPLPLALEKSVFQSSRLKIHNFYGSSETGGIAYDRSPEPRGDGACAGTAMSNVKVSQSPSGSIVVESAAVASGYWPEPGPSLGNGRYETSDLGDIISGQVFLRGRASDQINVAGRKFSPEQVERVLSEHELVRDCLVFGYPDEDEQRGEIVVACVVGEVGATSETLRQYLAVRLPAWQVPRDWWFVPSLEVSSRGKLSRIEWRARYAAVRQSV